MLFFQMNTTIFESIYWFTSYIYVESVLMLQSNAFFLYENSNYLLIAYKQELYKYHLAVTFDSCYMNNLM